MSEKKPDWVRAIVDGYKSDVPILLWQLKHIAVVVVALSAIYLVARLLIPDRWAATCSFPGPTLFP